VDQGDTSVGRSELGIGASLGPRFAARLIDSFLIGVVSIYTISIAGFAVGFTANMLSVAIVIGYFAVMESYNGRTIGKMALRLKTVGPDGGNPSLETAFRRNIWYLLGILPYIGGIAEIAAVIYVAVTISQSPMNIGWHDLFAGGTRVVRVER
jgi:uncharacterized RDD family membrane protein YckC